MYKALRKYILGALRHFPGPRQKARHVYYGYRTYEYNRIAGKTPTDAKTILFEGFGGRQFACSPKALYECICADDRFSDYDLIWSFSSDVIDSFRDLPDLQRASFVVRGTKEYFEACAKAKYWIINTRIAEYITPKDDQVYVQCWHGTPLKRLGYDVEIETQNALNTTEELADRFGLDARKWTYLLSPSPYTSKHLADAFGLPESKRADVVLEEGYPRNDRIARTGRNADLLAAEQSNVRERLGVPEGKKLLLYAPTWRDDAYQAGKGYVMKSTMLDFDRMSAALGDEWCILFRAHYYIANSFDFDRYGDFILDVSKSEDINDLYLASDALLTDYSSVFFDYANTKRPMLFYWPDYDHYANEIRGFYFDLKELPGPQCTTTEGVVEALQDLDSYDARYGKAYKAFRQTFCPKDDGLSSKRVVERIFRSQTTEQD